MSGVERVRREPLRLVHPERARLVKRRRDSSVPHLWDVLDAVRDPEIPALSIWQLGVLQDVEADAQGVEITVTPTYSGCPAMEQIKQDIQRTLADAGFTPVRVNTRLTPVWSSDWLDAAAQRALREAGIAPPTGRIVCPRCGSEHTEVLSEFGSTACKALCRCRLCQEVFDFFKRF